MNAWSKLPNAMYIDRVISSVGANPNAWSAARAAAMYAARDSARDSAMYAARDAARAVARDAARDVVRAVARDAARDAAMYAARDALMALIAWDDSAVYLTLPLEMFPLLFATHNPAALLLYPAAIIFTKEPLC